MGIASLLVCGGTLVTQVLNSRRERKKDRAVDKDRGGRRERERSVSQFRDAVVMDSVSCADEDVAWFKLASIHSIRTKTIPSTQRSI